MHISKILSFFFLLMLISACGSTIPYRQLKKFENYPDPLVAVLEARKTLLVHPDDIRLQTVLKQYEIRAANFYYDKGRNYYRNGEYDLAMESYRRGLIADNNFQKLQQAIFLTSRMQDANELYTEAVKNYNVGKTQDAEQLLEKSLNKNPEQINAEKLLVKLRLADKKSGSDIDVLDENQKITLNFRNTNIKTAFAFLARSFKVNIIFDEAVKEQSVTLFAKDISFKQALSLMLSTTNMFYHKVSQNTILIAPDTKSKREQYDDFIIRTFQLRTIDAQKMADIIKGVLKVNKIVINKNLNTIMVRDNSTVTDLVSKLIDINDRRPAELVFDVEILEVNRTKAEQLGINYGGSSSVALPTAGPAGMALADALSSGTITLPSLTFNYLKTDVDAETLANPKIRVLNRQSATIHIGDRVPLRSATIQTPAGGTSTSYEYTDIGIKLDVKPVIHYDNTVTVKLNLEVSTLGGNLGTATEPAYEIGTRTAKTVMLLKDGETAIIGGLIKDEDRRSKVSVPGVGDIPIVGELFKSHDDSKGRTDVLLTITPKIVRGWDIPSKSLQSIYSGTADHLSTEPLFPVSTSNAQISKFGTTQNIKSAESAVQKYTVKNFEQNNPVTLSLGFDKPIYSSLSGNDFTVKLLLNHLSTMKEVKIPLIYNKDIVDVKDVNAISQNIADIEKNFTNQGVVLGVKFKDGSTDNNKELLSLTMRGNQTGISYLSAEKPIANVQGNDFSVTSSASRIVIK